MVRLDVSHVDYETKISFTEIPQRDDNEKKKPENNGVENKLLTGYFSSMGVVTIYHLITNKPITWWICLESVLVLILSIILQYEWHKFKKKKK